VRYFTLTHLYMPAIPTRRWRSAGRRYRERQNFSLFPVGPRNAFGDFSIDFGFLHDGGEIIFNLLNGLQAYFLTDARGNRLNGASARQPGSGLGATASLASLGAGGALRIRF